MNIAFRLRNTSKTATVALLLLAITPRIARAEGDSIAAKYAHYVEDDGRMDVHTMSLAAEAQVMDGTTFAATYVVDTLAGATPTGQPAPLGTDLVPMSNIDDERTAGTLNITQKIASIHSIGLLLARSEESDYISSGVALNSIHELNKKNTTLRFGAGYTNDTIEPVFFPFERKKKSYDYIAGVTQVINSRTLLTANFVYGRSKGYNSDPYKLIEKEVEIDPINLPGFTLALTFPENRPELREKYIFFTQLSRHIDALNASTEFSYRFYHDTYGINAHTAEVKYLQRLGDKLILIPSLRYYYQTAADFYYYTLTGTAVEPQSELVDNGEGGTSKVYRDAWTTDGRGDFFSADYRLSELSTWNLGLKAVAQLNEHVTGDIAIERYTMHGHDGITPQNAYSASWTITIGLKVGF
ncbi:MAG: DUF3570 domain-containing protein [Verrucomicrobiota bacterium]|nr:DUF3570 domain-containing protein [Verrucomicrobiota bacterium]